MDQLTENTVKSSNTSIKISKEPDFVLLLVELVVSSDNSLQNRALELLHKLHTQTSILGGNIQKLQLILSQEDTEELRECKAIAKEIRKLVQSCELWFSSIEEVEKHNEFKRYLNELGLRLKKGTKRLSVSSQIIPQLSPHEPEQTHPDLVIGKRILQGAGGGTGAGIGEPDPPMAASFNTTLSNRIFKMIIDFNKFSGSYSMKEMLRNTGIISSFLEFLTFYSESGDMDQAKGNLEQVLQIFSILWLSVHESQNNKDLFTPEVIKQTILPYLTHDIAGVDFHAYFLLREILKDNSNPHMKDQSLNSTTIEWIMRLMEEIPIYDIRKSIYMDILSCLIYQNKTVVKQNQHAIIKRIFVDHTNVTHRIEISVKEMIRLISTFGETFQTHREDYVKKLGQSSQILIVPTDLMYLHSFIRVLTLCGDGKNAFSENIGQKFLQMQELAKILMMPNLNILTKITFMEFCYHMYLDTEKELMAYNSEPLERIWEVYINDLKDIASPESQIVRSINDCLIFTPDKVLQPAEVLNRFVQVLAISIENFVNRKFLTNMASHAKYTQDRLLKDCDELRKNDTYAPILHVIEHLIGAIALAAKELAERNALIKYSTINPKSQRLSAEEQTRLMIKLSGRKEEDNALEATGQKPPNPNRVNSINEEKAIPQPAVDPNTSGAIKNYQIAKLSAEMGAVNLGIHALSGFSGLLPNKPVDRSEENDINFRLFSENLVTDKYFKEKCELEFENLIKTITTLDSSREVLSRSLQFEQLSRSLIKFLEPESDEEQNEEIKLMVLRIFRKYIESAVPQTTVPSADWDLETYADHDVEIKRKQKQMIEIDIFSIVSKLFRTQCSSEVKMEIILLCISLLLGGNPVSQKAFYEELTRDRDNKVLSSIKEIIMSSFEVVKEKMVMVNDKELNSRIFNSKEPFVASEMLEKDQDFQFNLSICIRSFRLLQLVCEGHNIILQNYLRRQTVDDVPVTSKEINFIGDSCFMLGPYLKFCNEHTEDLGSQILDFLIDSAQGPCLENQRRLFNSKLIDFCKDFLNDQYTDIEMARTTKEIIESKKMGKIVKKVIKLLLALFEGNDGKEFAGMVSTISFDHLVAYLTEELIRHCWIKYGIELAQLRQMTVPALGKYFKEQTFSGGLTEVFEIYFFINIVNDITGVYSSKIRGLKGMSKLAFEYFKTFSSHIEMVFKGNLQKTYFVIQPACQYLPEGKKEEFMSMVSRDTPNDKLTGLIEAAPEMFDIMDHLCGLSNKAFGISPKLLDTFKVISLALSFFINLLVFVTFKKSVQKNSSFTDPSFNEDNKYLDLVGYCHVLCGAILIILWLMIEGPITIMNGFRLQFREYAKILHDMGDEGFDERQREIRALMNKNMRDLSISQRIGIIEYFNQTGERNRISATIEYIGRSIILVLRSGMFQYLLFYLTSSIFSLAYNLMLLYAIHLLGVINRFQTLQNVIKAITYNKTQLILTGMLALLVIYIYALFAYYFVNDTFFMVTVGDAGENVCTTVIQCYLTLINWGPRSPGSIGDVILRQSYQDDNKTRYYIRWWYDFTSFAIVNIIFLNIIFGIIIDTFAELRDQNNTKENDMKNFENKGDGFEHHIEVDHNVWNYIYFLYGIKRKDPTEYNGVEGFVSEKMEFQDVTWIPVLRALVIPDQEDSSGNLDQQLESLVSRVKGIHEKVKQSN